MNLALRLRPQGGEGVRGSSGYNHSIRYKNYVVHVQTEDAGARQAAVFTHVFVGGRAVGRRRASYADRLNAPDVDAFVRQLVYDEHRAAFLALRDGEYDAALEQLPAHDDDRASGIVRKAELLAIAPLSSRSPRAGATQAPSASPPEGAADAAAPPTARAGEAPVTPTARAAEAPTPPTARAAEAPTPPTARAAETVAPPSSPAHAVRHPAQPPRAPTASPPPELKTSATLPSIDLSSLDALERAAASRAAPKGPRPARGAAATGHPGPHAAATPASALRNLEDYRASGIVDLTKGELLASDGPAATGALVASLLEITAGHGRALAALTLDDEAGELILLGKSSCLLVRPAPARPGLFVYVACGRSPTNVARARQSLSAAADDVG